jgi:hypothetical protein
MAIFLGHRWAEDHEVKGTALESILNGAPTDGGGHMMADLRHFCCLRGKGLLFGLSVQNLYSRALCGYGRGFLTSCGQRAS